MQSCEDNYMAFTSFDFLLFFPVVALAYYIVPRRFRYLWLLFAGYYFYMSWSVKYGFLLLGITVVTYCGAGALSWCGRMAEPAGSAVWQKKLWMLLLAILTFGALFFYKYFNFLAGNVNAVWSRLHYGRTIPTADLILPLGISFYTFQAFGYLMDVYRGKTQPEKNFFRYALFLSFFPTLVSGPIERSDNLLRQLRDAGQSVFRGENVKKGLCLMLWGYFLKLVMAERIAVFVNAVYGQETDGVFVLLAMMLYGIQIYCDFAGYSTLAAGAAKVMGFSLVENFRAPYLSFSVSEFWRKWHMSLTGWFRDYLYIPLGGSKKGRLRKYRNIMIVFLVSGLWHGAGWKYVIWGGLNGFYQVAGELLKPLREKTIGRVWRGRAAGLRKAGSCVCTFFLVDFAWLFFRADSTGKALGMCKRLLGGFHLSALAGGALFGFGLNQTEFAFMLLTIVLLFAVDLLHRSGRHVLELVQAWHWVFGSCLCAALLMTVLIFGIYGVNYDVGTFIYFAF